MIGSAELIVILGYFLVPLILLVITLIALYFVVRKAVRDELDKHN